MCKIYRILAVNSGSSSTAGSIFSMARRVTNWMRSSMLSSQFNSVAMLHYHKERTDRIDLIKLVNHFAQSNENRLGLFGKFTEMICNVLVLLSNKPCHSFFSEKRCILCLYFNLLMNVIMKFGVPFTQSRGVNFQNFLDPRP